MDIESHSLCMAGLLEALTSNMICSAEVVIFRIEEPSHHIRCVQEFIDACTVYSCRYQLGMWLNLLSLGDKDNLLGTGEALPVGQALISLAWVDLCYLR